MALEAGGVLVGDKIDINIEIEAVRAAAEKVACIGKRYGEERRR